jgi:hypothetical protein
LSGSFNSNDSDPVDPRRLHPFGRRRTPSRRDRVESCHRTAAPPRWRTRSRDCGAVRPSWDRRSDTSRGPPCGFGVRRCDGIGRSPHASRHSPAGTRYSPPAAGVPGELHRQYARANTRMLHGLWMFKKVRLSQRLTGASRSRPRVELQPSFLVEHQWHTGAHKQWQMRNCPGADSNYRHKDRSVETERCNSSLTPIA